MTVVLLHALPLDERMWERYDGIAPRLYGRGNTMDAWARSLLEELEGGLVLVGASMGGYCALAMAAVAPERIRGLALVGSRPDADSPERRAGRAATIEAIRAEGAAGLWEIMGPKLFPDGTDEAVVERAREIALGRQPEDLVAAVEAIRDRADLTTTWESLAVPKLVAAGSRDPFVTVDEAQAFAAEAVAELHIFEDAGHLPPLDRPGEFGPVLDAFVERSGG